GLPGRPRLRDGNGMAQAPSRPGILIPWSPQVGQSAWMATHVRDGRQPELRLGEPVPGSARRVAHVGTPPLPFSRLQAYQQLILVTDGSFVVLIAGTRSARPQPAERQPEPAGLVIPLRHRSH